MHCVQIVCKCANCVHTHLVSVHTHQIGLHKESGVADIYCQAFYALETMILFYLSDESHFTVPGMKIIFQSKGVM